MSLLDCNLSDFEITAPDYDGQIASSESVKSGKILTPKQHIMLFSADDWEEFLNEWGYFQKQYKIVTKLGGANDHGIDVACFCTDKGFLGEWDNFQCKYYKGAPLMPNTAIPEIGKILWHIYNGNITKPRRYYFFAPKDCGPSLKKLLLNADKLKEALFTQWSSWCETTITSTQSVLLEGDFKLFVDKFDFSIFQYKPVLDVIDEHAKTPYRSTRFGGGLEQRPAPLNPPIDVDELELRYTEQLHEAYADHKNVSLGDISLSEHPDLEKHFKRQREAFYFAESLRAFARDSVPQGTFEALQDDLFNGVIDTAEEAHKDGLKKVKEVMKIAQSLPLDSNGLIQVVRTQDRQGICHQLANENKLTWVAKDD
ncbi:MAG: hypothetical protein KUG81_06500 [Gammaproteobacteria bacterium]|nr:hypothetical protein [Gammaproteobacteria bacterium]